MLQNNLNVGYSRLSYTDVKNLLSHVENDNTYVNRDINKRGVDKLMKIYTANKEGFMNPILVNCSNYHIIDGQHRCTAFVNLVESGKISKDSTLGVQYYALSLDEERDKIFELNISSKNWSELDYMQNQAKIGNESVIAMTKFAETYKDLCKNKQGRISSRITGLLLNYDVPKSFVTAEEQRRYYQTHILTESNLKEGIRCANEIMRLKKSFPKNLEFTIRTMIPMISTWRDYRDEAPLDKWCSAIYKKFKDGNNAKLLLDVQSNSGWESIFEKIGKKIRKDTCCNK